MALIDDGVLAGGATGHL